MGKNRCDQKWERIWEGSARTSLPARHGTKATGEARTGGPACSSPEIVTAVRAEPLELAS